MIKNNFRTTALSILTVFFIGASVTSCQKDDATDTTPKPSIVGFWKAKHSDGTPTYPTDTYAYLFRANGTVRVYNKVDTANALKAEGKYTIVDSTVKTNYTFSTGSTFSGTATLNSTYDYMQGTWGNGTNETNGGLLFLSLSH